MFTRKSQLPAAQAQEASSLTFPLQCQTCVYVLLVFQLLELNFLTAATAIGFGQHGTCVTVHHRDSTVLRGAVKIMLRESLTVIDASSCFSTSSGTHLHTNRSVAAATDGTGSGSDQHYVALI
jgi:hypothetical protein